MLVEIFKNKYCSMFYYKRRLEMTNIPSFRLRKISHRKHSILGAKDSTCKNQYVTCAAKILQKKIKRKLLTYFFGHC